MIQHTLTPIEAPAVIPVQPSMTERVVEFVARVSATYGVRDVRRIKGRVEHGTVSVYVVREPGAA